MLPLAKSAMSYQSCVMTKYFFTSLNFRVMVMKKIFAKIAYIAVTSATLAIAITVDAPSSNAVSLSVSNAGFEDPVLADRGFTVLAPIPGWGKYDPSGLIPPSVPSDGTTPTDAGVYNPPTDAYSNQAPEGNNVGFAFVTQSPGSGVIGFTQTLASTLTADTIYNLNVEVGDPIDYDGFGLTGFPGYAVQLLAGGTVLAEDNNTLRPTEGTFATSTVSYTSSVNSPSLGQPIEIRLLNLNLPQGSGSEVDFDNVRLAAEPVPEPSAILGILAATSIGYAMKRKSGKNMRIN